MRGRLERAVAMETGGVVSGRQGDEDEQVRRCDEQREENNESYQSRSDAVCRVDWILMSSILRLNNNIQLVSLITTSTYCRTSSLLVTQVCCSCSSSSPWSSARHNLAIFKVISTELENILHRNCNV